MPAYNDRGYLVQHTGEYVILQIVSEDGDRVFWWPVPVVSTVSWPWRATVKLREWWEAGLLTGDEDGMLTAYKGDTIDLEFEIRDKDGNLLDLTDAEARFTLKGGGVVIKKATANVAGGGDDQINILDAANGKLAVYIGYSEVTMSGPCYYELEITKEGRRYTVIRDVIEIKEDIVDWESL